MAGKAEIEKIRHFPMPLTSKEQKSLIKKEIKQEKKSKRREKIPEKEIYMRVEKKGGHRLWLINGEVVGANQFAEGVIPYNAKEI
jgi:hypothetical protein